MTWLRRLLAPAPTGAPDWAPTHQHRKGGFYRELHRATLEADGTAVVVYDDAAGQIWVRPTVEFDDGRFTSLSAVPDHGDPS